MLQKPFITNELSKIAGYKISIQKSVAFLYTNNKLSKRYLPEENKNTNSGTSLVVQWLRIRPPVQGTRVWALVWEEAACRGATKPMHHNYWACALGPASHNYWSPRTWSPCSATREATAMRSPRTSMKSSPCSPQLEKARTQQWRPNAVKNK